MVPSCSAQILDYFRKDSYIFTLALTLFPLSYNLPWTKVSQDQCTIINIQCSYRPSSSNMTFPDIFLLQEYVSVHSTFSFTLFFGQPRKGTHKSQKNDPMNWTYTHLTWLNWMHFQCYLSQDFLFCSRFFSGCRCALTMFGSVWRVCFWNQHWLAIFF